MSKTVIQNKFDGGIAEDIRTTATDQCEKSLNFDVFTNPHYLQPYPDTVEEFESLSGTPYSAGVPALSEAGVTSFSNPNGQFVSYGYENDGVTAANVKPEFFFKSNYNGNWIPSGYQGTKDLVRGSLVIYKDTPYVYELDSGTGSYRLIRASAMTSLGSVTATNYCRGFVHPEDNVLYMGFDYTISKWDGTTFTSYALIPTNLKIVSLTNYGTYLAILCTPTSGIGRSMLYLWGRDGTINTLQGIIDVGEDSAKIVENINNNLIIISTTTNYGSTTTSQKIIARVYAGGSTNIAKVVAQTATNGSIYSGYKVKKLGILYFTGDNEDCIYAFGKNKEGYWIISKDRYLNNGTTQNDYPNQQSFSLIGDILYVGFKTNAAVTKFYRTGTTYASTSVYKTTINPSMPVIDRTGLKQLEAVQVAFTGVASGTIGLKYSVDGSAMTSIISQATTAIEDAVEATNEATGTVFLSGNEFQFQIECTGGVKIKEIRYRYSMLNNTI